MRLQTYIQMLSDYGIAELEADDNANRKNLLSLFPFSLILEGEYAELDTLNKWIEINIGPGTVKSIFYGKTSYDYGFAEYFFAENTQLEKVTDIVPRLYSVYENKNFKRVFKSNGYDSTIIYDPEDKNAVLVMEQNS